MKRLLVVDDSPAVRLALTERLEAWGCTVLQAENGAVALKVIHAQAVDGVFLDLNMPLLDGAGFLRALRALGKELPVVLLTASESVADVAVACKLGVTHFVAKPFHDAEVAAVMLQAFEIDVSTVRRLGFDVLYLDKAGSLAETGLDETVPPGSRATQVQLLPQLPDALKQEPQVVVVAGLADGGEAEAVAEGIRNLVPDAIRIWLSEEPSPANTLFHRRCDSLASLKAGLAAISDAATVQLRATARPGTYRGAAGSEPFYWLGVTSALMRMARDEVLRTGVGAEVELDLVNVPDDAAALVATLLGLVPAVEALGLDVVIRTGAAHRQALQDAGLGRALPPL